MINLQLISKETTLTVLFLVIVAFCNAQFSIFSFEHVNVIPMTSDTVLYDQRVIIQDGKIRAVESASKKPPAGIQCKIEAAGKFLVPGFTDVHFHNETNIENEFKLLITNGITSAVNMAERPGQD